jgi:predicted amidohydrolase YtcJ
MTKDWIPSALITTVLLSACMTSERAASPLPAGPDADTVLTNGSIKSPSGWEKTMAVRNGEIVAFGEQAETLVGPSTLQIDLEGRAVFPGLHDMHVHPYFAGIEEMGCKFASGAAPEVIKASVKTCVDATTPGQWVEGGNWVAAVFEPGQQTRQFLDEVSPDNPVFLWDESHHSAWVNSKALELAGIDSQTPDPEGGIIDRDGDGRPTGVLRESAVGLVESIVPPPSIDQRRQALMWASQKMLSYGITSFTVASVRAEELPAWISLYDEGLIPQRARGCIVWAPDWASTDRDGAEMISQWAHRSSGRLKLDCVKMFVDGVPTESRTANMLEPYLPPHHNHDHTSFAKNGELLIPQDELNEIVTQFDAADLHVKFHVVGDGAVRAGIKAVAFARSQNGPDGPRHDLGHNSFVHPDDFQKALAAGVAWEFSPYIWYPTPIASIDITRTVGSFRMERWIPIADAIASGNLVVAGSDWSVVPSVNPFLAIETMVTRQRPGGGTETLGPGQAVSLEDAFQIMTQNGAELMGHGDQVGTLEIGKQADFFIASENLFEMPITQVHNLNVEATFIAGKLVFADDEGLLSEEGGSTR